PGHPRWRREAGGPLQRPGAAPLRRADGASVPDLRALAATHEGRRDVRRRRVAHGRRARGGIFRLRTLEPHVPPHVRYSGGRAAHGVDGSPFVQVSAARRPYSWSITFSKGASMNRSNAAAAAVLVLTSLLVSACGPRNHSRRAGD